MWTGQSSTTHITFDGSGSLDGQNLRFEMNGNYNGLWFNARQTTIPGGGPSVPRYIFNLTPVIGTSPFEIARFSKDNGFMRVGTNPSSLDAANTLEIDSWIASDTTVNTNNPTPSTGESGLRFTKLTSASTPFANPGNAVLSVDDEGDVILVPANNNNEKILALEARIAELENKLNTLFVQAK